MGYTDPVGPLNVRATCRAEVNGHGVCPRQAGTCAHSLLLAHCSDMHDSDRGLKDYIDTA